jgi:alanine racemase
MTYTLNELCSAINGTISGDPASSFVHISVDSRTLSSPANTLFVALRGERNDGHRFIGELIRRGVKNFLVESVDPGYSGADDINFVCVPDSLRALQDFVIYHRSGFNIPVIGITGSNGKTIVKEWLFQMLQGSRKVIRSPKSYNSQVGVPLSVWMLDSGYDLGIFEAGISKPGEMKFLRPIIQPDIGIITNIKDAHQENFRDYKEKAREKLDLFSECKTIIYCRDHEVIDGLIREFNDKVKCFTWSSGKNADVIIKKIEQNGLSSILELSCNEKTWHVSVPFSDDASLENISHVITCLLWLDVDISLMKRDLGLLSPVAMRLELIKGINQCTLINDSYNSDLASLTIALDFLNQQNQHKLKTLILSDIFQSGKKEEDLYQEVSEIIKEKGINRFIGVGESLSRQKNQFQRGVFYLTTNDFLDQLKQQDFADEAILIKGSRSFNFEKISLALRQKVHGTVMEVNLTALIYNLNLFRSMLKPETGIMIMVKAFSYGSGSWEIANVLQYEKVDWLCVAFADEGIALRQSGISLPILVMNPEITSFELMIEHNLEPELYNFRSLLSFEDILKRQNVVSYPVHIKLDTGMHRLGFSNDEIEKLIRFLKKHEHLEVRTVFSHLAAADEPEHDEFTRQQIRLFTTMSDKFISAFQYRIKRHILNSAGIERFAEAQYDMVRLGIGLYGISLLKKNELRNVCTLKSTISQIKTVLRGESVGYGRVSMAAYDRRIGIVPVGYADGINRRLGNGTGRFLVRGIQVPVIGNICMDMCFVDLTSMNAEEGDEVIIFGESMPVWKVSELLDTIPYEILTGISTRVQRIYYQES